MIIKNPDALKCWLVGVLEPLCDADSSALARYVLALLKKDKAEKELKKVMIEQLDVFLSEQTNQFVEQLFEAIGSENYINSSPNTEAKDNWELQIGSNTKNTDVDGENQEDYTDNSNIDISSSKKTVLIGNLAEPATEEVNKICAIKSSEPENICERSSTLFHTVKTEPTTFSTNIIDNSIDQRMPQASADKENQPREYRRWYPPQRLRSRSRSRSSDRFTRRSRSKDRRVSDREKLQRQFKNKLSNSELRQISYDKRRTVGDRRKNGSNVNSSNDHSPKFESGGVADGAARKGQSRINSESKSRSPSIDRTAHISKVSSKESSPSKRCHNPSDSNNINRSHQRCRDFDEKGYCVRGETCPWDHGVNPVVFEGVNNPSLITMSLREYNPDVPDLWSSTGNTISTISAPLEMPPSNINPFTGTIRPRAGTTNSMCGTNSNHDMLLTTSDYTRAQISANFRASGSMVPFSFSSTIAQAPLQRELIPVPVIDVTSSAVIENTENTGKRRFEFQENITVEGSIKRKVPINSRLGSRPINIQNNCSLELRKVPRGLNTIAHLNNHFAKFGKIVNIQISYDGDPEAAIVTFSNHAEANVAYRSTEAVLNNRFIKVFWHNQDMNGIDLGGNPTTRKSQYHLNKAAVMHMINNDSGGVTNLQKLTSEGVKLGKEGTTANISPNSIRIKSPCAQGLSHPTILRKKHEQAKAVVQLANGLRKRKQELLQSYLKQMKTALDLVERCEPTDPQRAKTLDTIKVLQKSIDKLRKEINAEQEHLQAQIQNQPVPTQKKTKEQQKKELLDIELELFAQQQEGNDTTAIQKRLDELQKNLGISSSTSLNITPQASTLKLNSSMFHRGTHVRCQFPDSVSTRVDRRTTSIIVSGFAQNEINDVLSKFQSFGKMVKHDINQSIPQLILHYSNRINAEQAMSRGKLFRDKNLQISWMTSIKMFENSTSSSISEKNEKKTKDEEKCILPPKANLKLTEAPNGDTLPELPLDDDEEDEECEDRSWRR